MWGPLAAPAHSPHPAAGVLEQVAEEGLPHVHGHTLTDAGQEHQVPKGQQSLGERPRKSGGPGQPLCLPSGPPLLPYLEAIEDEQVGTEVPGLMQEAAHVVPCVLGHDLHQLAQEQGDLHVH